MTNLNNTTWLDSEGDYMVITKNKNGYYGISDNFDFERKTKEETISQLKKWNYKQVK